MHKSGLYAITDRQVIKHSFDRIAELMDVLSASFVNTYPDVIRNMKISILNYVQALRTKKGHPDLPFGVGNDQVHKKIVLDSTREGYPILPILLPYDNWNKMDWENLFTMYMGWHYSKITLI